MFSLQINEPLHKLTMIVFSNDKIQNTKYSTVMTFLMSYVIKP